MDFSYETKFRSEKRIVAFIDILRFKNSMAHKDKREIILDLLYQFRKFDSKYSYSEISNQPGQLSIRIIPDISSYADHTIISIPLESSKASDPLYLSHVLTFTTHHIMQIQLMALVKGIALRGAISFGEIYYDNDGKVMEGTSLFEAIEDEKSLARYPRVVASKKLLDKISEERHTTIRGLYDDFNHLLSFFNVDFDGVFYLDFLRHMEFSATDLLSTVQTIKNVIEWNLQNSQSDFYIFSTWAWLATYFDNKIDFLANKTPELISLQFKLYKNNYGMLVNK